MERATMEPKTTQTWKLDKAHAKLGFSITHMMVSEVEGSFKNFDITIKTAKDDFTDAQIELTADVNSIDTQNEMRDAHMKKEDFFHHSQHPSLTFKSTSLSKLGDNKYELNGLLTLMGVTKPVKLDVKARTGVNPMNNIPIAGFKVTGAIKRSDFGLAPAAPGLVLSDEVEIVSNVEFIKA
jgi:polyisoprenoid-binding protein YceI